MAASWAEVLDLYGQALAEFDEKLGAGEVSTAEFSFQLPADLGPLPPELAETASAVAHKSAQVEERVRDAMTHTAREQGSVTRARAQAVRERPQAKFIDVNG